MIVEQVKDQANVRRADPTACQPESKEVLASADVQEELQEEAAECLAAKEALLAHYGRRLVPTWPAPRMMIFMSPASVSRQSPGRVAGSAQVLPPQ